MIDNLLKEGGGILRRLPSAAMAIMLAVTLAIPQGLALADPAPVSEDVEAFGHANSEAQPVISESNTSTEMADKGDGLEQEVTPDQETQPDNPKEENPVSKEPDEDSESIKNEASDVEEEAEQPVDPLLLASQAPPVMGSIARDLSTISGTASMVCLNPGPTNDHYNRFGITMPDGQYLIGHCMDYGQAAPADGTYNFTGVWDSGARAYNVTLDTTGANKNPGSLAPYPCQRVGNFYWTPKGSVELYKSSTKPDMTNGNPVYSLSGAKYDVYRSNDDGYVLTLTTNASGYASASGLPYGNYYCVESQPPTGFFKDTSRHYFDVSGNAVIRASDVPYDDPVGALLHKADPLTGGTAQGGGTLGGAEFTVKYYAGYYSSDPAAQGISPMRTWVMRTDSDGFCYFDSSYVVSGDPFYIGAAGTPTFPLGTVTVQETKAPEGYVLSSAARPNDVFVQRITMSGIEGNPAEVWNEHQFLDDSIRGGVKTTKLDGYYQSATAQGDGTMQGATFAIKNASENPVVVGGVTYEPGKDVATITSGADGVAQTASDLLPYGTYELRETVPPEGYLLSDEVWRFEIREDGVVVEATTEQSIDNQVIRGGVKTAKLDHQSQTSVPQGSASVEGAVFAIKSVSANPVLVDGIVYEPGKDVATITSGADGVAQTASDLLPYGTYELRETVPPEGYLLSDEVWRFEIREDGKVVEATTEQAIDDQVKAAECFIIKVGTKIGDDVTEGDKADAIPLPGVEFSIYASKDFVDNGDGTYTVRDGAAPYATIVTDENGIADTSYNPRPDDQHGALPYDDYLVIETGPKPNYDPIEPFTFSAREDKKVYHFFANNTYVTAGVELVKVDAESGLPVLVAGTQLQVLDASKTPIVWHETYPEAISYDTLTVGDTGRVYLPQKLNAGSYYLREVSAPEGYLLGHADVPFTVSTTTDWDDPLVVEYANMPQKGVIEIVKTDEADGRAVPGAVYEVTAAADIVTPDGTVHASSGDVVATVTTGDDGKAETDELYLGDYNVRETATPDGWAIDHETHMVELSYAGQEVKVTRTVLETADAPTTFILLKKAELIDGELVDYAGSEWHVWAEDAAGEIAYDATATTGEDGSFVLERIPHGDGLAYYCQETKTGDDYILDPEVYEFSVDEEGLIAGEPAYVFLNTNYHKRIIEAHKVDQDTGEPVGKTGFGLYRWIGEGEPDPTFGGRQGFHGVFADDPDGEVDGSLWEMVAEGTTDDMGAVIFEGLEFGWYMMVEAVPNPDYAEWWESAGSTWGRYLFKADKDSDVRQTQTYGNMAISLECNVSKATIDRTSAAFQSDERAPVRVDNVGKERYRYDVAFDAGSTNVRADQYAVVDPCEFVNLGIRLDTLVTPAAYGDTDGLVNVWYRTNMTDTSAVYSTASATAGNPPNQMADGTDRIGTVGWRLWREGVAAGARTRLDVDGLGLAAGEYVTGIMLEYGSVEVGFRTLQDMSYLVYATEPLDNSNGEVVIPNSVTSHITRNWRDGQGLYDDAHDNVITRVIDTFGFASSYHGFSTGTAGNGGALTATGDRVPALEGVAMLLAAVAAVLLGIWATRREEGEGA